MTDLQQNEHNHKGFARLLEPAKAMVSYVELPCRVAYLYPSPLDWKSLALALAPYLLLRRKKLHNVSA